jgi:hypothetical protein
MRPVEKVLRMGEGIKEERVNLSYIVSTLVDATIYPQYNYNMLSNKFKLRNKFNIKQDFDIGQKIKIWVYDWPEIMTYNQYPGAHLCFCMNYKVHYILTHIFSICYSMHGVQLMISQPLDTTEIH